MEVRACISAISRSATITTKTTRAPRMSCRRHPRRGAVCRRGRAPFGVDRRASFFAGRAVLPRSRAGAGRGAHQAHPPRAGGDGAAAASPDPRRRAMGDARSAQSAGASISPPGAAMTGANTPRSASRSRTTRRSSRRAWRSCAACGRATSRSRTTARITSSTTSHHAAAGAAADPGLCRLVLETVDRACRAARLRPDRGAVRRGDDLRRAEAGRRALSRDLRQVRHQARPADVQLFPAFRRHARGGAAPRARQIRYYRECAIAAFPGDPATAPPSYRYFIEIVDRLHKVQPEDLSENAVLIGSAQIIDTLKRSRPPASTRSSSTSMSG